MIKIKKTFTVHTIIQAYDYRPLAVIKKPYEEQYPFWQLFYVSRGQMQILRDGKEETVSAGQVVFRPPGKKSVMLYPDDCTLYVGIIDFICHSKKMSFFPKQAITLDGKEKAILSELIKEAADFCRETKPNPLRAELVSSGLENLLIRLYGRLCGVFTSKGENEKSNSKNIMSEKVRRINAILEERRFSSVSIEEIASMLSESPNVLMKCYKKEMQESIMEHFFSLKEQTAKTLILSSNMNFTEISDFLGFSSVNYFSKFFKKRTGMTPTEYSRQG
ncbi:MAG: AraC family transcriptional regulator [Ruminococcaceae bacterium]|nr:AraC family transcriptional regulator [Oscillospiraceae bacterium]